MGITIDVEAITGLLNSAFVFGDTTASKVFLWDLRTYSLLDKNYDIYFLSFDNIELGTFLVGRDFFEFVRDFCLGMKSYEVLPEDLHPRIQELRHTFARFSRRKISPQSDGWQQNSQTDVILKPTQTIGQESEVDWNPYLERNC